MYQCLVFQRNFSCVVIYFCCIAIITVCFFVPQVCFLMSCESSEDVYFVCVCFFLKLQCTELSQPAHYAS